MFDYLISIITNAIDGFIGDLNADLTVLLDVDEFEITVQSWLVCCLDCGPDYYADGDVTGVSYKELDDEPVASSIVCGGAVKRVDEFYIRELRSGEFGNVKRWLKRADNKKQRRLGRAEIRFAA